MKTENFTDDEKRGAEKSLDWFEDKFTPATNGLISTGFLDALTSTLPEAEEHHKSLPLLEQTMGASFELMFRSGHLLSGNLKELQTEGDKLRKEYGVGAELMEVAHQHTKGNVLGATAISTALGLLPPGLPSALGSTVDLGTSMLLCFRGIAQVAALYGKPPLTQANGYQFVLDSFSLGTSSSEGEGLLAYLDDPFRGRLSPVTIGAVKYGGGQLQKHLWTRASNQPRRAAKQAIDQIARLCGLSLSQNMGGRLAPIAGALFCGKTTYALMNNVLDASIHIAARDALTQKAEISDEESKMEGHIIEQA